VQAIVVKPRVANSAALIEFPEPTEGEGGVLLQTLAVGVCGTDREIVDGNYGQAPPGEAWLVLGHESLARVVACPADSGLAVGDFVVPMVRHPDPVPCPNCAAGEWDMCRNGRYTEHGIKEMHGFGRERYRLDARRLVKVDAQLGTLGVLLEPTSVVAKAWEHIERIGQRAVWQPRRVLVTGAGPIGLLAALLARQRGYEVHVLDRVPDGPKPELVRALGATYLHTSIEDLPTPPDIALECTGAPTVIYDVMRTTTPGGITCLAGVSSGGRKLAIDMGNLNRELVLENDVVFGSVNANRRHYEAAAAALAKADHAWLTRLIARRVPLAQWSDALTRQPHDVKTVIEFPH
jgi:threonine dehydrogenase-like Zn-dependent dehydrogenase